MGWGGMLRSRSCFVMELISPLFIFFLSVSCVPGLAAAFGAGVPSLGVGRGCLGCPPRARPSRAAPRRLGPRVSPGRRARVGRGRQVGARGEEKAPSVLVAPCGPFPGSGLGEDGEGGEENSPVRGPGTIPVCCEAFKVLLWGGFVSPPSF